MGLRAHLLHHQSFSPGASHLTYEAARQFGPRRRPPPMKPNVRHECPPEVGILKHACGALGLGKIRDW